MMFAHVFAVSSLLFIARSVRSSSSVDTGTEKVVWDGDHEVDDGVVALQVPLPVVHTATCLITPPRRTAGCNCTYDGYRIWNNLCRYVCA